MNEMHEWWGQLRHGGVLITPALLAEFWPEEPPLDGYRYHKLRDAWVRLTAEQSAGARREFIDALLEDFLGLEGWRKGPQVAKAFKACSTTGQNLRPDRVLVPAGSPGQVSLLFDESDQVGVGRGRRSHAHLVELLRSTGIPIGILTNGAQLRLVFAGPDYDAWTQWDIASWFDEGDGRSQLAGLQLLLGADSFLRPDGAKVLAAIQASRSRQGELAQVLGEQVRQGIESLLAAFDAGMRTDEALMHRVAKDPRSGKTLDDKHVLSAMYHATTRLVMRLVVVLYAEARDLLPRTLEAYHHSYGVEGLYHQLAEAARDEGPGFLADRHSAWPRLLALFDLIHGGSAHEGLPLPAYGGALFRPGDADDADAVSRALAAFEDVPIDDATVYQILRLLKIGRLKVRRGKQATWVAGPVDFSDLRTEYIGIVYEGLLDFELRRAAENDPIVFLNLGKEPALPLSRLESLPDSEVADLIGKLKKEKATASAPAESEEAEDEDVDEEEAEEEPGVEGHDQGEADESAESADDLRERVFAWAERAVEVAKLVRKPRGKKADLAGFARERRIAAAKLVGRIVGAGDVYLVAWGGTRKGSGTFYTRPSLAVPTTQRTLEPFCYTTTDEGRTPRTPEEILAIKVCDPAMGSGSFLVAALRYITEALLASLIAHERVAPSGDAAIATLPFGKAAAGNTWEELIPVRLEDDRFEDLLRARLARHVVERCIYGVDINPMAVELARLALWVETMDRELPFEFLDHKLKSGNALVGGWLHLIEDYPAKAWDREGGDGKSGTRTKWLKQVFKDRVKPELADWIAAIGGQGKLFGGVESDPAETIGALRESFTAIHDLPRADREIAYRDFLASADYAELRQSFDRWCAVWFWPAEAEPALTPAEWQVPSSLSSEIASRVADEMRFFHWELEFPDVFTPEHVGFDAVIGNPPWEISKPNSLEFFSNHDPLYRSYGKQEALDVQKALFADAPALESEWTTYQGQFKAMSNWISSSEDPFDVNVARGNEGVRLKDIWQGVRAKRPSVADPLHPYRYQGSADLNTYKMFLEVAHHVLAPGGRLGFLVPSGIYTDKGTTELRRLFLEQCVWEWCFGFENRAKLFPIDSRFKYNPIIVQRGGTTEMIRAAFMRHDVEEWESPNPETLDLAVEDVRRFAPKTFSFLEAKDRKDLEIAEKIYGDHPLLDDFLPLVGGGYSGELHMTGDSSHFVGRRELSRRGLLSPGEDTRDPRIRGRLRSAGFFPLYEGKMIWLYDAYFKDPRKPNAPELGWVVHEDQLNELLPDGGWRHPRLVMRSVGRSADQRTLIVSAIPAGAFGHSLATLGQLNPTLLLAQAVLGSLVVDYLLRMKVSANLTWNFVGTLPMVEPSRGSELRERAVDLVPRLNQIGADFQGPTSVPILAPPERFVARAILDVLIAAEFGLDEDEVSRVTGRFPIYDRGVPNEFRYPSAVHSAFRAYLQGGVSSAEAKLNDVVSRRVREGLSFNLDEVYVPPGGWDRANAAAVRLP